MNEIEEAQAALEATKFQEEGSVKCQRSGCEGTWLAADMKYDPKHGRRFNCPTCGMLHYRTSWVRKNGGNQ
jgi:predicted RNA-binding Zn-ribbon protein involved in translation (DUF1610 family)